MSRKRSEKSIVLLFLSIFTQTNTITFDCLGHAACKDMTLNCNANEPCIINCDSQGGQRACGSTNIYQHDATTMTVNCLNWIDCEDNYIHCGSGSCTLNCGNSNGVVNQCTGSDLLCATGPCNIYCYSNSCTGLDTPISINTGSAISFQCTGDCSPSFPAPLSAPTNKPTQKPTPKPTPKPTKNPSINPSPTPTSRPTPHPTHKPTMKPTTNPSANPTPHPTLTPTKTPTSVPTQKPTLYPTLITSMPTGTPTDTPSTAPTLDPSKTPSLTPSFLPTNTPTLSTYSPTKATDNPSFHPTKMPTTPSPILIVDNNIVSPTFNPSDFGQNIDEMYSSTQDLQRNRGMKNDSESNRILRTIVIVLGIACVCSIGIFVIIFKKWRNKKDKYKKDTYQLKMTQIESNTFGYVPPNITKGDDIDLCNTLTDNKQDRDIVKKINRTAMRMRDLDVVKEIDKTAMGLEVDNEQDMHTVKQQNVTDGNVSTMDDEFSDDSEHAGNTVGETGY